MLIMSILASEKGGGLVLQDFKMFDDWNKSQEELAAQAAIPREPVLMPASWGKRVIAYLIDSVILGIPLGSLLSPACSARSRR
jgi:hypothetical protein